MKKSYLVNNRLGRSEKKFKYLFVCLFAVFSLCLSHNTVYAGELIDYHGVSSFYGESTWTSIGPDTVDDYKWYNISYFMGKNLKPWMSFEVHLGPGHLETDNHGQSDSLESRFLLDFHKGMFFLKLGGGVLYMTDSDDLPGLAESDFYAIASGSTGLRYSFSKEENKRRELTIAYAVEHLSDPTKNGSDGDDGWNVGALQIAFNWSF